MSRIECTLFFCPSLSLSIYLYICKIELLKINRYFPPTFASLGPWFRQEKTWKPSGLGIWSKKPPHCTLPESTAWDIYIWQNLKKSYTNGRIYSTNKLFGWRILLYSVTCTLHSLSLRRLSATVTLLTLLEKGYSGPVYKQRWKEYWKKPKNPQLVRGRTVSLFCYFFNFYTILQL